MGLLVMKYNLIILASCMVLLIGVVAIFMPIEQQLIILGVVFFGLLVYTIEIILPMFWKKDE